jgi:hypothetical protein
MAATLVGKQVADRLPARNLKVGFVALLVLVAGYTAWQSIRGLANAAVTVLERAEPEFFGANGRCVTGLSSGEGLIAHLKDGPGEAPGDGLGAFGADLGLDLRVRLAPERDPRLLIIEPEWGKVLRQNRRQGNTLSGTIREAWDNGPLQVLTRQDPIRATHHHIGIVGHVTVDELLTELDTVSAANGFANRHLFIHITRRKILPNPPPVDQTRLGTIAHDLRRALQAARERQHVTMSAAGEQLWEQLYRAMEEGSEPHGVAGHLVQRGPAQTLRLALIYALAEQSDQVEPEHLRAAQAVWGYSQASVLHVFGHRLGNPVAERLLRAVRRAGEQGLSGRGAYEALDGNVTKESLDTAVAFLERLGLVQRHTIPAGRQGGRPATLLVATGG